MITLEQFGAMIPTNKEKAAWYEIAVDMFKKYDIMTNNRIAGFMAQCGHESADFTLLEENLNYSEASLLKIFARYFGPAPKRNAAEYARKPEMIANYVYQDEFRSKQGAMGNTKPGDGWKFRGRGIKQLTGRNNYTAFAKTINMSAEEAADYLTTKKGAFESACWFWKTNNLASYADKGDIVGMSKRVNGGTIGLNERTARWNKALSILGGKSTATTVKTTPTVVNEQITDSVTQTSSTAKIVLQKGSKGPEVAKMQKALGITADGDFGLGTKIAVTTFQKKNGLTADGIAGPSTLAKLYS